MSEIAVASLHFYPIKSWGRVEAQELELTPLGFRYDREWVLQDEKGKFVSQRTHPEMTLGVARVDRDTLIASAPGHGTVAIPLSQDPNAPEVPISIFKKPGTGFVQSSEVNQFFSDYLGEDVRLLRIGQPRHIKPECVVAGACEQTAFPDGFPEHLGNLGSLALLNTALEQPVTMERFRTNIDVSGDGAPAYDEDYWRQIQIGDLTAFVVRACARCPIPDIDPETGSLPGINERAVTQALHTSRYGIDLVDGNHGDFFGQNLVHVYEPGMTIKVGDPVTVSDRAPDRNIQLLVAA